MPRNADQNTIRVLLGDQAALVTYIESPGREPGARQVNVEVPDAVLTGQIDVRVLLGTHASASEPVTVEILP